ncbi:MAG: hypothetical protein WC683_01190 [bacterium]
MLDRPPEGRTTLYVAGPPVGVLVWEPGNGARYVLQATRLGTVAEHLGGDVLASFSSMEDHTFVGAVVSPFMTGHWNVSYVRKTWQRCYAIGDHQEHMAMLLNWGLGGEFAWRYAAELWRRVYGEGGGQVIDLAVVRRG